MSIEERIAYDKEHKDELAVIYGYYIKDFKIIIDRYYTLKEWSEYNSITPEFIEKGFHLADIFHLYYVLNCGLCATLQRDGQYRIFTLLDTPDGHTLEFYECVTPELYSSIYKNISTKDIEMPDHPII
jgi:hypothetical protein